MDYLQYLISGMKKKKTAWRFKPYYRWITFNTTKEVILGKGFGVLNLIIDGLPSIQKL